ncbi:hypothetical protein LCGC14_2648580 [marine sediment metagenome]|uniref:Uncharacterized protein n=1 Tax=marine sediment metagenome TaxID=412755 RepID=A0A0F9CML6_9ZZZZ
MNRELIESCCDELAFDNLDVAGVELSENQLDVAIDKAAEKAGTDRATFLAVFEELFRCNPFTYVENLLEGEVS